MARGLKWAWGTLLGMREQGFDPRSLKLRARPILVHMVVDESTGKVLAESEDEAAMREVLKEMKELGDADLWAKR